MGRPREHDDEVAEALVDAAGRLLSAEGAAGLSLRRLAEQVGVSTTAVYSLFGGKAGLVRALHRTGFARLADELATVESDEPVARVRALAHAYRRAALRSPHLYDVMFACPVPEFVPTEEDLQVSLATLYSLREAVEHAVGAGALTGDVDDLTMVLWGVVHGMCSIEVGSGLGEPELADQRFAIAVDATLAGLAPHGGGTRDPTRVSSSCLA